jgi:t-SNARE complex subunit (syntaxin)
MLPLKRIDLVMVSILRKNNNKKKNPKKQKLRLKDGMAVPHSFNKCLQKMICEPEGQQISSTKLIEENFPNLKKEMPMNIQKPTDSK